MDPSTILAGASALTGLLGAGKSGKSAVNTNVSNTFGVSTPNTNTFGLALSNNPTIANLIGAGSTVAPSAGGASLPQTIAPYTSNDTSSSTSPQQSAGSDGAAGTSYLPRSSPTGAVGIGAGYASPAVTTQNNQLLLLLLICAGGLVLVMET